MFQKTLNKALATQIGTPGAMVAIWTPGSGKWVGTAGTSDPATKTPVDPAAYFRIGSQTKPFTVTLLLQLVDEGKLSLGDTIEKWFPSLPDAKTITVKQLTDMTSGIKSYTTNPEFLKQWNANPVTIELDPDQLISWGRRCRGRSLPAGMLYSDTNTVMVGRIKLRWSPAARSPSSWNEDRGADGSQRHLVPDAAVEQPNPGPAPAGAPPPDVDEARQRDQLEPIDRIVRRSQHQHAREHAGMGARARNRRDAEARDVIEQRRNIPLGPGNRATALACSASGLARAQRFDSGIHVGRALQPGEQHGDRCRGILGHL